MSSIYPIAKIEAEAIAATVKHSTAESACRFPLESPEGMVFIRTFDKERQRQEDAITAAEKPHTDAISADAAIDIRHSLDQFTPAHTPTPAAYATITVLGWAK
jgi:hypothetical protein